MEEKVPKLRENIIKQLKSVEEGMHTKPNYNSKVLELLLFQTGDGELVIDECGNRIKESKHFALPMTILKKIDFSSVKVSGIDFRHSGARINPQQVYMKDISNCKFDNFNISPFSNFDGVTMYNTDFSECNFKPTNGFVKKMH